MQVVQHGAGGAAAQAVRPVAVQRVLADVEIEGREIGGAEGVQRRVDAGPVVGLHGGADLLVQLGQPVQHPAFQLRHFGLRQVLGGGEAVQAAQQPAQRVAQAAVQLGLLLEDLRADAHVLAGVRRHHPQAQDVRAVFVVDLLRRGDVAERLGHLAALLVHHEAMRQHRLERRPPARAHGFQQRGMEPAAMLVGAFQVQVGRPGQAARLQHEGVGGAAFEPHVHDVHHLLIGGGVAAGAEEAFGGRGIPAIRPFLGEGFHDAGHHRGVAQRLAAGALHEHGDRHAPGALAADAPVRTGGDHAADAVAALVGHEIGVGDGLERLGADVLRPVHADEPLRGGAEDQRRLAAPGMRVGMRKLATGEQAAGLDQRGTDRVGRLVDVDAGEMRHPGVESAVLAHRFGHFQALFAAEVEILLAVARGDVDEAGAGLGGDVVGQEHRHVVVVAAAAHRVGADGAGEVGALDQLQHVVGFHLRRLAELRQQGQRHQHQLARPGQRALGGAVQAHQRIVELRPAGDGAVAGHGPGGGGPDHHAGALQPLDRAGDHREAHGDGGAGVVVVLDLGLGQRGFLHRGPHHRAQAAVQGAIQQELADFGLDRRLGGEIERGVALLPVAEHAQAAELGLLDAHPMLGVGAAFGAELQDGDGVLVAAGGAVLFLDLPLDRQAVAVPAGDVVSVVAAHLAGAVDHVLEDLVQRGADVQVAVRVGRAVMQDELLAAVRGRAHPVPQAHAVPALQDRRLLLRQVAAHGEGGGGQEHGVAVVAGGVGLGVGHCILMRRGAALGEGAIRGIPALSERPGR